MYQTCSTSHQERLLKVCYQIQSRIPTPSLLCPICLHPNLILENRQKTTRIDQLVDAASARLKKENIEHDLYRNKTAKRLYFELRFKNLLYELGISRNKSEKLSIKLDFENIWLGHKKEVVLVNRYGFLINIVTLPLNQQLIQKLVAYTGRVQTQPRDIYDITWLIAQGAKPDWKFAKENGFSENLMLLAKKKFKEETRKLPGFKARLKPYLISESYVTKLDLFPQLLERTGNV